MPSRQNRQAGQRPGIAAVRQQQASRLTNQNPNRTANYQPSMNRPAGNGGYGAFALAAG